MFKKSSLSIIICLIISFCGAIGAFADVPVVSVSQGDFSSGIGNGTSWTLITRDGYTSTGVTGDKSVVKFDLSLFNANSAQLENGSSTILNSPVNKSLKPSYRISFKANYNLTSGSADVSLWEWAGTSIQYNNVALSGSSGGWTAFNSVLSLNTQQWDNINVENFVITVTKSADAAGVIEIDDVQIVPIMINNTFDGLMVDGASFIGANGNTLNVNAYNIGTVAKSYNIIMVQYSNNRVNGVSIFNNSVSPITAGVYSQITPNIKSITLNTGTDKVTAYLWSGLGDDGNGIVSLFPMVSNN